MNECVERVPGTFEAAKQLLEYGLRGTDARILAALGKENKDIRYLVQHEDEDGSEDLTVDIKSVEDSLDFSR